MNRLNDEFRRDSGKGSEELEREIDATRASLLDTLEQLEHRLSPSEMINQALSQMRRHGGEFTGNLGQSLKDHPMPALLTSVGIAWMMASEGRSSGGDGGGRPAGDRLRESGGRMRERWRGASESLRHRGESARSAASGAREAISESSDSMSRRAQEMSGSMRRRAQRTGSDFGHLLQEQPLLLGALGLAAGAIAGAALPPSEHEDRAFGPLRDRALDRAKAAGAEGARQARARTERAAGAAAEAARDDGSGEHRTEQLREQRTEAQTPEEPTRPSSPGTGLGY